MDKYQLDSPMTKYIVLEPKQHLMLVLMPTPMTVDLVRVLASSVLQAAYQVSFQVLIILNQTKNLM